MADTRDQPATRKTLWQTYPWLLATGLLLMAVAAFIASHLAAQPSLAIQLLQRVSEASLVGGIADWFAVVALFRRPLGLPIPHTAVIPHSKDRIGAGIGAFAERHLFDPEAVMRRLRSAELVLHGARWLSRPENAAAVAERATQALAYFVAALPETEVRTFVRRAVRRQLSTLDLVPLLAATLEALRESGRHQEIYDRLIRGLQDYLRTHRLRIREQIEHRSAWWVPKAIDRRVASTLIDEAIGLLDDLLAADNAMRDDVDRLVATLIEEVNVSAEYRDQIEAFKRDFLTHPAIDSSADRMADDLRRLLTEDMGDKRMAIRDGLADGLITFAARLIDDAAGRERIERRVLWMIRSLLMPWRRDIGRFIADVVRSWDAQTVARRLEDAVGDDLQYIRINGTLVGGLVGGVIFVASELLF